MNIINKLFVKLMDTGVGKIYKLMQKWKMLPERETGIKAYAN